MFVLGIETSCDETAAALVRTGADGSVEIIDQIVASQIALHQPFGGVVPELATRQHLLHLSHLVSEVLKRTGTELSQLDGIGVTRGPGLPAALLVGMSFAKGLALASRLPWVGVNHLEGHLFSAFLSTGTIPREDHIALIVSGGHTLLIEVNTPFRYHKLGGTLDDAAGEAFDKGARMLGLPYPGGPEIEKKAKLGNPAAVAFPRAMLDSPGYNFSFSGLKNALRVHLQKNPTALESPATQADLCASYQEAIADVLAEKTRRACRDRGTKILTLSGGVGCNTRVREKVGAMAAANGIRFLAAPGKFSTDNATMIAVVAAARLEAGETSAFDLDADPNLRLTSSQPSA